MTERQYKDSGIGWIGKMPDYWYTKPVKFLSSHHIGGAWGEEKKDNSYDRYCVRIADFDYEHMQVCEDNVQTIRNYSPKEIESRALKYGDLIIEKSGGGEKTPVGRVVVYRGRNGLMFANFTDRFRLTSEYNIEFAKYVFFGWYNIKQSQLFFNQTTGLQNLDLPKFFGKLHLPVPPLEEQQNIADFLDSKTASIDSAIQAQKDIVEKLKEYRQAVITEAVTKGLNRDVKMKNVDFLWVHEFPENWGIYKLNHLLDYNHPYPLGGGDHGSIKAKDYATCGIPLLRVQNLGYAEPINTENMVYISEAQNKTIKNSTLHPDDILFAKTGATIGKTAILTNDTPIANTTSHVGKITVNKKKFFPRYVYYFLSSEMGMFQLWDIAGKKATRPEVGLDEVKYIKFLIPNSIAEQKAISDYLDAQCSRIANAISHCNAIIEKLEEYKKSIIYNAVTGKIDCRKDVIPE